MKIRRRKPLSTKTCRISQAPRVPGRGSVAAWWAPGSASPPDARRWISAWTPGRSGARARCGCPEPGRGRRSPDPSRETAERRRNRCRCGVSGIRSSTWADCNGSILLRGAPLGVPVVPLVSSDHPARAAMGPAAATSTCPAINSSCSSADDPHGVWWYHVEHVAEFVVGENADDLFSCGDVGKLRAREAAVHQHQPDAEFIRRPDGRHQVRGCCDAAPRSPRPARIPLAASARASALEFSVEFAEAERAAFVGDRRRVAVAGLRRGRAVRRMRRSAACARNARTASSGRRRSTMPRRCSTRAAASRSRTRARPGQLHAVLASAIDARRKCPATCKLVSPPSRGHSQ